MTFESKPGSASRRKSAPPVRRRGLSVWKKVIFALVLLAFVLGAVEGASRLVLAWLPRPGLATCVQLPPKPPNTVRIFIYGGSTAAGFPCLELGFAQQLAFWTQRYWPQQSIEILNFSRPGKASSDVLALVSQTVCFQPDIVIVMSGHNEFLSRYLTLNPLTGAMASLRKKLDVLGTVRLLERLMGNRPATDGSPFDWPAHIATIDPASADYRDVLDQYEANIAQIEQAVAQSGARLYLCTLTSNLRDWPPAYKATKGAAQASVMLDALETSAPLTLEQIHQAFPDQGDPMRAYLCGRLALRDGQTTKALEHLILARDLDRVPLRAPSRVNQFLHQQGARPGVTLIDIEQLFMNAARDGVPGFDLIADNCHPLAGSNALITRRMLEQIGHDLDLAVPSAVAQGLCEAEEYLNQLQAREPDIIETYHIYEATYCLKPPFMDTRAARFHLQQALRLRPENWKIWANLAATAFLEGKLEEGYVHLSTAIKLNGGPIDLGNPTTPPLLEESLRVALAAAEKMQPVLPSNPNMEKKP